MKCLCLVNPVGQNYINVTWFVDEPTYNPNEYVASAAHKKKAGPLSELMAILDEADHAQRLATTTVRP